MLNEMASYNLKFNALAIELYCADFEINSNSRDKGRCPSIVTEAQQKTGLADTWRTEIRMGQRRKKGG
jgi:hypothetical protein